MPYSKRHTNRAPRRYRRTAITAAHASRPFESLESRVLFADSAVVFNEIMYHPAAGESSLEWVEFHNLLAADVDVSRWTLRGGIDFDFAEGTVVPAGGRLVLALDPAALRAASGYDGAILGPFSGRLDNSGERLTLRNNSGRLMDQVEYRDEGGWPVAADGGGVSLAKGRPDVASD